MEVTPWGKVRPVAGGQPLGRGLVHRPAQDKNTTAYHQTYHRTAIASH